LNEVKPEAKDDKSANIMRQSMEYVKGGASGGIMGGSIASGILGGGGGGGSSPKKKVTEKRGKSEIVAEQAVEIKQISAMYKKSMLSRPYRSGVLSEDPLQNPILTGGRKRAEEMRQPKNKHQKKKKKQKLSFYQTLVNKFSGADPVVGTTKSAAFANMAAASKAADGLTLDANDLQNIKEDDDWDLEPEGSAADFESAFDVGMNQLSDHEKM
jgi:hypothetical protein